jgi:hypothetical protein
MPRRRGEQKLMAISLRGPNEPAIPTSQTTSPLTKAIALWASRQFLASSGIDVKGLLSDVNSKVEGRGFILWDGQILIHPISATERIDEIFEGDHPFEPIPKQQWESEQKAYFGLENPYQMSEDGAVYTQSHIVATVHDPYLAPTERIAAILHGEKDEYYFYCTCHQADVVYTTHRRLLCMGCGALHAVLREPAPIRPKQLLSTQDWIDLFDEGGTRRDEPVDLSILDFQDVEDSGTIWTTKQWADAKHRFIFFARSSPEVVEEATRGTEADPSIFLEAGWSPIATSPPPAHQIAPDSVDVTLTDNAAHCLEDGVSSYLDSRKHSSELVSAVPAIYRAAELLLKARLEELDPGGLLDHPNNPTVIRRLAVAGVCLPEDERRHINQLRRIRNSLQHGTASLNHRQGLSMCRNALIFIDRFVSEELGLWLGDALASDDWYQLLAIPQIAQRAERHVKRQLDAIQKDPNAAIASCERCKRDTLVRPHPKTGSSCIFCGHIPVSSVEGE